MAQPAEQGGCAATSQLIMSGFCPLPKQQATLLFAHGMPRCRDSQGMASISFIFHWYIDNVSLRAICTSGERRISAYSRGVRNLRAPLTQR